ncbi:MAG: exodeoxyribonuclease III [Deltaproteobacteria bacterium]
MRIASWNVNGLRACVRKGFCKEIRKLKADVIGLQETRVELADVPEELGRLRSFPHFNLHSARSRKGYSGVGLLAREAPEALSIDLGVEEYDIEGRFQMARLPGLLIANAYFPNGSGKDRDNSRVPYKLAFTRRVFDIVEAERKKTGLPALIFGDFNTAPQAIDLARPGPNEKTSGFLPEERAAFTELLARGWVDTFRHLHPEKVQYSWWSQRFGVRAKNIGWRIDQILASEDLVAKLRGAFVWDQIQGSDHCPIGVDLDL